MPVQHVICRISQKLTKGANWWYAFSGKRFARISADVAVPDVTKKRASGASVDTASINGKTVKLSPTLAA